MPALLASAAPLLVSNPAQAADAVTYVSALPWTSAVNGLGPVERDRSNGGSASGDGGVLTLQGKTFARGLGAHAASDVRFEVPAGCSQFKATVGVDDAVGRHGSVVFSVFDGSTRRYLGQRMTGNSANVDISVPVTPGNIMRLVVGDAGDGTKRDQADWADARLVCASTALPVPERSSLLPNGGAEADAAGWTAGNATLARVSSPVRTGSGAFAVTSSAPGHALMMADRHISTRDMGPSVHVSAWVRSATTPRDALLQVDWGSGTSYLSTSSTPQAVTTSSGWTHLTATLPVPADAATALFYVKFIDTLGGERHYVDDILVEAAGTPTPEPTAPAASPAPTPTTSPVPAPTAPTAPTGDAGPSGQAGTWSTIFTDDFDGNAVDRTKWSDHEPWQAGGYADTASWNPSPHTAQQIAVSGGQLALKARRGSGLPGGKNFTSGQLNTRGKFTIPAGVTSYTEARIKAPSARGLLPGFWLLGNGDSSTGQGWPITGEIDIVEFANNNVGEAGSPFFSLWYPKDVYTNAPGTWMNATHVYHTDTAPKRHDLYDSYHTWGLFRSPEKMELYIDGVRIATYRPHEVHNGNIPLPPMLFTNEQHIRLSLIVGGWGGTGWSEAQYQEGDLAVDYVKVWKQTGA